MASRTRFSSQRQPSGKAIGSRSRAPRNAKSAKASAPNATVEMGRGHRTAYVPLKHGSEAITDRWSRTGRKGAAAPTEEQQIPQVTRKRPAPGLSPTATRAVLYKIAKRLAIKGRSAMTKRQLFEAISTPGPDRVRARSR